MKTLSQEELRILKSFAQRIDQNDPAAHNNLAVVYFNKGLYEDAINELKKALDLDPDFNLARINLEIVLRKSRGKESLIKEYQEKLERNPNDINLRIEFAKFLYQVGRYSDSLVEYRNVLIKDNKNISALKGVISCYKKLGKFKEAIAAIRRAQKFYPDDTELKLDLAELFYNQGQYDPAIKLLKEIIEVEPENARAHLYLSFALGEKGYLQEALEEALKAKELDPRISRLQSALEIEEEESPSIEDMLQESIGIREIKTDPFESKINLLNAYKNKLFLKEAKSILEELKKDYPERKEIKRLEAEILILEENWEEAIKIIEKIEEKDFHTWNMLGVSLYRTGEREKARKIFEKISNYPYALNNLGVLYVEKDKDMAKNMFKKAYEIEPGFILPLFNIALIGIEKKDYNEALSYIKEVCGVDRDNPVYLSLYAKILIRLSRKEEAREILSQCIKSSPDFYYAAYLLSQLGEEIEMRNDLDYAFVFQYLFSIEGSPKPIESRIFPEREIEIIIKDKDEELKKVKSLIKNKKFEDAEIKLLALNKKFPEDDEIKYLLALTYENLGYFEKAERIYVDMLRKKEDDKITFHLAHIYFRRKKYENAEKELMKIIEKGKEYVDVLLLLARVKERQGELNEAFYILKKVLQRKTLNKKILLWFGELLEKLGRYNDALKEYFILFEKFPDDPEVIYSIGRVSLRKKDEVNFKKALELLEEKGYFNYYNLLKGIEMTLKGDYQRAIEYFTKVQKDLYLKEELHYYSGVSYALTGKYEKAIEEWTKVIRISENSPLAKKAKEYSSLALKWLKMLKKEVET